MKPGMAVCIAAPFGVVEELATDELAEEAADLTVAIAPLDVVSVDTTTPVALATDVEMVETPLMIVFLSLV